MEDKPIRIKQRNLIKLTLFCVFVVSCSISEFSPGRDEPKFPEDERVDRSFITKQPCEAPCWYGLTLGVSTDDDIRAKLLQLAFVDQATLFEQPMGSDGSDLLGFYFDCVYYNPPGSCGVLEVENGKLSKIMMAVQYLLSLQMVIDQLGTPIYYTANPSPNEDICVLEIFWPEKNIIVTADDSPRKRLCTSTGNEQINMDMQIKQLIYIESKNQEQRINEGFPWLDFQP
jgi:hypothetical protein